MGQKSKKYGFGLATILVCLLPACKTSNTEQPSVRFKITQLSVMPVSATHGMMVKVDGIGATPGAVIEIWIERSRAGGEPSVPFSLQLGKSGDVPPGVNADNLGLFHYERYEPCQGGTGISSASVNGVYARDRSANRDTGRILYQGDILKCP